MPAHNLSVRTFDRILLSVTCYVLPGKSLLPLFRRDGKAGCRCEKGTVTGSMELCISLDRSLELAKGPRAWETSLEVGPNHELAEIIK